MEAYGHAPDPFASFEFRAAAALGDPSSQHAPAPTVSSLAQTPRSFSSTSSILSFQSVPDTPAFAPQPRAVLEKATSSPSSGSDHDITEMEQEDVVRDLFGDLPANQIGNAVGNSSFLDLQKTAQALQTGKRRYQSELRVPSGTDQQRSAKVSKLCDLPEILRLLGTPCSSKCQRSCFTKLLCAASAAQVVLELRRNFLRLNHTDQNNHMVHLLREMFNAEKDQQQYVVHKVPVCQSAFRQIYSLSQNRISNMVKLSRNHAVQYIHGAVGCKRPTAATLQLQAWLTQFFDTVADHIPNKQEMWLPAIYTKQEIFMQYVSDTEKLESAAPPVSVSHFYNIWAEHFSSVKIKKSVAKSFKNRSYNL